MTMEPLVRPRQEEQRDRQRDTDSPLTFVSHRREQICRRVRHSILHRTLWLLLLLLPPRLPRLLLLLLLLLRHVHPATRATAATPFSRGASSTAPPCVVACRRAANSSDTDAAEGLLPVRVCSACTRHPKGPGSSSSRKCAECRRLDIHHTVDARVIFSLPLK